MLSRYSSNDLKYEENYISSSSPSPGSSIGAQRRRARVARAIRYLDENRRATVRVDTAALSDSSAERLRQSAGIVLSHKTCPIYIIGHADEMGGSDYNDHLAWDRANVVGGVLESLGVSLDRQRRRSYGESKPQQSAEPAKNRRVEFYFKSE